MRYLKNGFFLIGLFLVLSFPRPAGASWQKSAEVGKLAPDFTLSSIDNGKVRLKDYCGPNKEGRKKAVVLIFFAEWCKVCHDKELPYLKSLFLQDGVKDKLQVLAIAIDQEIKPDKYRSMDLPFPVLLDRYRLLAARYGFNSVLPLTILIYPNGRVANIWEGYKDETAEELKAGINKLLADFN